MNQNLREANILVVDDNAENIEVLEQMLRKSGYDSVHSTADSRQVIPMTAELAPDLLILDLFMPPPDGFAILDELRVSPKRDKLMPILVLTGDVVPATKVKALAMGAKDFLTKPVDRVDLLLRVRNLLTCRFAQLEAQTEKAGRQAAEQQNPIAEAERAIISHLADLAGCIDPERSRAGERVADFTCRIGTQMHLEEAVLARLRTAARLFDLGMLTLPESIRESVKTLSSEERRQMKRHTLVARQLFGDTRYPALEMARDIAIAHHERWDGAGYPVGLHGAEIPLAARIVAVAQVYDALVTDKPYRPAMDPEKAVVEVQRQSGFAFDPDVIAAFLRAVRTENAPEPEAASTLV